uniref:Uncharacterized protein n=1 Tax=Hyaloperonospora arabidopsidis (strain Emoy2) TaxID=559515 RepID=M4C0W5_HYAAE
MEEAMDYGSDTSIQGDARTMSDTFMSEVQPPTTLSPFTERDDANAPLAPHLIPGSDDAIITNPLDEQQQLTVQRDESARRHAQIGHDP